VTVSRSLADIVTHHIEQNRTALPVFEGTSQQLYALLGEPDFELAMVQEVIQQDPVLTSALLRLANSSFFGGLEKITSASDAVMRLGARQVGNAAMMVGVKKQYHVRDAKLRALLEILWRHSVACGLGARWLCEQIKRPDLREEAFVAGLLHDIGKLFLLRVVDDLEASQAHFNPPMALVYELLKSMHATQGAALLRKWNLPEGYIHVVEHHHDVDFDDNDTLLVAIRLVDRACARIGLSLEPDPDLYLAASAEAQALRVSDLLTAELEIELEDAAELA